LRGCSAQTIRGIRVETKLVRHEHDFMRERSLAANSCNGLRSPSRGSAG
jgi:hypothetical protein